MAQRTKQRPMGDAAKGVLGGPIGADALAAATGASTPQRSQKAAQAPKRKQRNIAKDDEEMVVTTVRLRRKHWKALREEAHQRSLLDGGRADASEIIRELVKHWMKKR